MRKETGMNQIDFGKLIDKDKTWISKFENAHEMHHSNLSCDTEDAWIIACLPHITISTFNEIEEYQNHKAEGFKTYAT